VKRCLVKLMLFLLLGAIVNVAVAWGCAIWAPSHGERARRVELDALPDVTKYGLRAHSENDGVRVDNTGLTFTTVITAQGVLGLTVAGWPQRSMEGALRFESALTHPPAVPTIIHAVALGNSIRRRDREFPNWPFVLPLRPIWPGFAVNTVFYAAVLWLLIAAPFALRRRRRIRRGLCPKCAYDLRGSAPGSTACPECGATK